MKLAQKEEKLLEKDFIYEQVTRLTEKISAKVENGKGDTLVLAKKVRLQFVSICVQYTPDLSLALQM